MMRLCIGIVLAILLGAAPAQDAPLVLVPTYGLVTAGAPNTADGRRLRLREAMGGDALDEVRHVDPLAAGLDVATSSYRPDRNALDIVLTTKAPHRVELEALRITFDDGSRTTVPIGHVSVVPNDEAAMIAPPIRGRATLLDGGGGLFHAHMAVNDGDVAVRLVALDFAPTERVTERLLVRTGSVDSLTLHAFDAWTRAIMDVLAERWMARAYREHRSTYDARSAPERPDLHDLPAKLADGSRWEDPTDLDVVLAPGEAVFLALTPAAFVDDVQVRRLWSWPRLQVGTVDGRAGTVLQLGGPMRSALP